MKPFLKILIIITGLYVIASILFDLNFNSEIHLITKIIQTLFFLLLLIYVGFIKIFEVIRNFKIRKSVRALFKKLRQLCLKQAGK